MATEIRCNHCRSWFDAKSRFCLFCEHPRPGFSSHLYTTMLNDQLYRQAESAEKEKVYARALAQGYDIPPSKAQYKMARQIVADM